ncbi:MAG TPA: T9SS type A sorting domain-containing protein [Candidatus Kapabacteria bacterium]|nr:T9SS type A sorting domain-containing protein [Candidatus Kapabacteria bacterium]
MRRILFALPFLVLASGAWGQDWTQITHYFGERRYLTPYFLNANVGFTFYAGISFRGVVSPALTNGLPNLLRTEDAGKTWIPIDFFDSIQASITQICFVSIQHGYVATSAINSEILAGGIFETLDQGDHWKKITPDGLAFSGIYATNNMIFASEITDDNFNGTGINGEILFSQNDGRTWDSITNVTGVTLDQQPEFQWICGNRDSLVSTVYFAPGSYYGPNVYLVFSTDLGLHWQSSLLDDNYSEGMVSLHISPHSCNIIREHLDGIDGLGDTYSFFEAPPPYKNWDTSLLHIETGAWIAGNSCAMYLSYAGQEDLGPLQRSTDDGSSWTKDYYSFPGGPGFYEIDDADFQNLSIVGHGATIYATSVDYSGEPLWKSTDGGDGTLSAAALAPEMALSHAPFPGGTDTLQVQNCEQAEMMVTNFNIGCSSATFDSATVVGLAPSEYSITSTHYCGCTHLPDTSFIVLAPKDTGIRNVTVHFHYTDDEFNQIDTALALTLDVKSGGVAVAMSLALGLGTITAHAGDTIEIPVYLSSDSSITLSGATSITLPFAVDTNVLKVISFAPAIAGATTGGITYGGGTGTVRLQIPGLTISGRTLIGYLRCVVYLADTLATSVSLAGASINAGAGCVSLSADLNSVNIAITGCGDSTLLRFMQTGQMPFTITSVNPNPAHAILTARLINPRGEGGRYRVLNALGAMKMEGNISGSEIEIDVAPLSNGIYLLQIESQSGFVASRRFLIER